MVLGLGLQGENGDIIYAGGEPGVKRRTLCVLRGRTWGKTPG